MGAKYDALPGLGIEHGDDVLPIDALIVVKPRPKALHDDRVGITSQLRDKPIAALGMSFCFRHTRPECRLRSHKPIGRIGVELGYHSAFLVLRLARFGITRLPLSASTKQHYDGKKNEYLSHGFNNRLQNYIFSLKDWK